MQPTRWRILCIDDDEDTCRMMQVLLGMWNYEVVVASTPTAALHQIQSEPYDAYLLDTFFPEVSGVDLCEQICAVPGHAPVIFVSAAAYESDKQRGLEAGALAYLTKPLDFDALEITLARLLPQALENGHGKQLKDSREVNALALHKGLGEMKAERDETATLRDKYDSRNTKI